MYMAAQNVIKYEPYFKAIYAKQMAKGKTAKAAFAVFPFAICLAYIALK